VQEADHPQEIEKTEKEGRKAACGFGEIGENCDFTSPRAKVRMSSDNGVINPAMVSTANK
jgi:hypothetical protein